MEWWARNQRFGLKKLTLTSSRVEEDPRKDNMTSAPSSEWQKMDETVSESLSVSLRQSRLIEINAWLSDW
jgi:hypothetical protein